MMIGHVYLTLARQFSVFNYPQNRSIFIFHRTLCLAWCWPCPRVTTQYLSLDRRLDSLGTEHAIHGQQWWFEHSGCSTSGWVGRHGLWVSDTNHRSQNLATSYMMSLPVSLLQYYRRQCEVVSLRIGFMVDKKHGLLKLEQLYMNDATLYEYSLLQRSQMSSFFQIVTAHADLASGVSFVISGASCSLGFVGLPWVQATVWHYGIYRVG